MFNDIEILMYDIRGLGNMMCDWKISRMSTAYLPNLIYGSLDINKSVSKIYSHFRDSLVQLMLQGILN